MLSVRLLAMSGVLRQRPEEENGKILTANYCHSLDSINIITGLCECEG